MSRLPDTGRRVLFSAQRNEGPFLLEWIAYHKIVGFTDIQIWSNDCTDGSDVLLDQLAEHGEIVHRVHDPGPDRKPQMNAAEIAVNEGMFADGDWVMWLDLDEFLWVQPGAHRVDDLIAATGGARSISVAWRVFGDSGNAIWPGRHISDAFVMAALRKLSKQPQFKTLFQWGPETIGLHLHRPVLRQGATRESFPAVGSNNAMMSDLFYNTDRNPPHARIENYNRVYRLGQVAHFIARTPDLYEAKKVKRGRGYRAAGLGPNNRHAIDKRLNRNEVEERCLLKHEPAVIAEMRRLFQLDGVASACDAIEWFNFPERDPE